jgi:GntR family transcriptional repressor for pyruvate dehydrogenase complex
MKAIQRVPIVQQVADGIKELITDTDFQEGDKLPTEKALCEMMGVGRGTVREAFRLMQSTGMVEIRPGRGAFVASKHEIPNANVLEWFINNETLVRDIVEVRVALEPLAARLMAQRCTQENLDHLERIHKRFLKAATLDDRAEMAKQDARFHSYIIGKSGNYLMETISQKLEERIQMYCEKTFCVEKNMENAITPHSEILRAIRERDPEESERQMRAHLNRGYADLDTTLHM